MMTATDHQQAPIERILRRYHPQIENAIRDHIPLLGSKTELRDACEYALTNGGKRFRPALVYLIAEGLGKGQDVSQAALCVEFFHTASLIADDLPCMDDDDERREKPSLHKVYGEGTALLASYALIAAGYGCLAENAKRLPDQERVCVLALENATTNTGLLGATGGQFLDVNPPDLSECTLREILHKKTVSLFEIAFVLGWLFGGGATDHLDQVKKAALHFGMAFQIADDLGDQEQDRRNGRLINTANVLGTKAAQDMFQNECSQFLSTIGGLPIESRELSQIIAAITL